MCVAICEEYNFNMKFFSKIETLVPSPSLLVKRVFLGFEVNRALFIFFFVVVERQKIFYDRHLGGLF